MVNFKINSRTAEIVGLVFVCLTLLFYGNLLDGIGQETPGSLPKHMTPEEELLRHLIGQSHRSTPPPEGPVRNPGEFEPMTGVLVRWPFGFGADLIREMAEDVIVWIIVPNSTTRNEVQWYLESEDVNMENVKYIVAPSNSIWTRDYGPWFIVDGSGLQGIVDHIYNRPRPDDDAIPQALGDEWDIPVYGMNLTHTGGNYISDGRKVAMSTCLVYDENPDLTQAQVDSLMKVYLGVERYFALPYIETEGIHHINCWAKFLSPDKILVKQVSPSHPDYDRIEVNVIFLQSILSSYGRPYEIIRIPCPDGALYTNSLILNDKVLVPTFGIPEDSLALSIFEAVMPGYEVLGFSGPWRHNDALHCRIMGITDPFMLHIDHIPLVYADKTEESYRVEALIVDGSGMGLISDSLLVYWKTASDPHYTPFVMNQATFMDSFYANIPAHPIGTKISYYISAADHSGRKETHPHVAPGDAHSFRVHGLLSETRGDVNGDGQIDVLDVVAVINHILGRAPLKEEARWRADCDGDEKINTLDALGIVKVIVGTGECEP